MSDFLAPALEFSPDAAALSDRERRWTFRELAGDADRLAGRLGPAAVAGSTVALVLPATAAAALAVHAVTRTGAVVAPLHPGLTVPELTAALEVLRPVAVVTGARELDGVRAAASAAGIGLTASEGGGGRDPRVAGTGGAGPAGWREPVVLRAAGGRTLLLDVPGAAAVVWTSGTTGWRRGVVLAGSAFRHVASASRARLDLAPGDRWYASLSPAHVGGLALVLRASLLGAELVTREGLDLEELWDLMAAGAVSHASLVPVLLRRLLEVGGGRPAPAGVRCLLVGGARAAPPLVRRAVELGYPVALTYGLTEATSQVATAPPELVRRKRGTVGPPLPGVEVRTAEDGEILVRGPTLALGTVASSGFTPLDRGEWLRTGDLGAWDDEGHLRVTGRRSDRIVTGGVTVDPGEVEAVLLAHPAVREAAVVGLADPEWGERVAAALVMDPGGTNRLDDVEALCRERLTSAKIPRRLRVVTELPRNPAGKVDRSAVRLLLE